jgi:hypothetical protein
MQALTDSVPTDAEIKTRSLPCKLTREEVARYGEMLAAKLSEIDRVEEEKKIKVAEYAAQVKALEADVGRFSAAIKAKEELRPVDVFDRFVAGTMQTVRIDTGAVVTVRPATAQERQLSIPGAAPLPPQPENGAPAFPDLTDGPRGDDLAAPAGGEDEAVEAAASVGELVESSVGDQVFVGTGDQDDEDPFAVDEAEDGGDDALAAAIEGDPEDEYDVAYTARKSAEVELETSMDPVVGGEAKGAELKQAKKSGPKGPRKAKADKPAADAKEPKTRGKR